MNFDLSEILRRGAQFVDKASPTILLLASPLFLLPTPARAPTLLLIPALWFTARFAGHKPLPRTPLDGAFFFLVLMICVSVVVTPDIVFSLPKIVGLLFGISLFYMIVRITGESKRLGLAIQLFILGGATLALVALVGTNWLDKFTILAPMTKWVPRLIRGIPGAEEGFHPNAVAGTLVMIVPLQTTLIAGILRSKQELTGIPPRLVPVLYRLNLALLILTGGTLLLTQSRGAWAGLICALIIVLAWHGPRSCRCLAVFVILGAIALVLVGPSRLQALLFSQGGPNIEGHVVGRLEMWSRAIDAIHDFPLTGMGMNIFRKAMPILYSSIVTSPDLDVAHAHNHLLQAALDLGLPGLVAYLALWLGAGHMLITTFRSARSEWVRVASVGLGCGLIAHFIFGVGDAIPLGAKVGVFFWFELALVVSLFNLVFRQVRDERGQAAIIGSHD